MPPLADPHLVAVLHELSQVEKRLSDLGDVLGGQRQLDAADELVLLVLAQLGPTREEGGVEEVSVSNRTTVGTRLKICHLIIVVFVKVQERCWKGGLCNSNSVTPRLLLVLVS